jgi:hypothetical protein
MLIISCFIAEWLARSNRMESSDSYPADKGTAFVSRRGLLVTECRDLAADLPSTDLGESGIELGVPVLDQRRRDVLLALLQIKNNSVPPKVRPY